MTTWRELPADEYDRLWDRFDRQFDFRPSVDPASWPGIREPTPSATYAIGWIYGHPDAASLERDLEEKVFSALRRAVPAGEEVFALDWRHPAYAARTEDLAPDGPVPVLPNGDYYIFTTADFRLGLFGHPWEQTMCVFGASLLQALAANPPALFARPVRH